MTADVVHEADRVLAQIRPLVAELRQLADRLDEIVEEELQARWAEPPEDDG